MPDRSRRTLPAHALWLIVLSGLLVFSAGCVPPDRGAIGDGSLLAVGMVGPAAVEWRDHARVRRRMALEEQAPVAALGAGDFVVMRGSEGPGAGGPPCALRVRDLAAGRTLSGAAPCGDHERIRSVAVDADAPAGDALVAYVGLEDVRELRPGRVVALSLPSGGVLGSLPLSGTPLDVRVVADRDGMGALLYVLERIGGDGGVVPEPERHRLVVSDAMTLDRRWSSEVASRASHLAVSPGGESVFVVAGDTASRIDPADGVVRWSTRLPGLLVAAEVMGDLLYVASPEVNELWVLDTRAGYRMPSVPLSGHPVALGRN